MTNPTSTSDLETRWRPLTTQEEVNAEAYLADAWEMLKARRPTLEVDMAAGTVTTGNVVRVVSTMVLRVLKNPGGYVEETLDDWTGKRDPSWTGNLYVTASELADVTPNRRGPRSVRLVVNGDV